MFNFGAKKVRLIHETVRYSGFTLVRICAGSFRRQVRLDLSSLPLNPPGEWGDHAQVRLDLPPLVWDHLLVVLDLPPSVDPPRMSHP